MKTITKVLDEAAVNQVEALGYEVEARKSVISEMLAQNMDTSTAAFASYQKELVTYMAQFEEAKRSIAAAYVDSIPGAVNWNLDYASRTLTINVQEG